jgi:hypothetical protein
MCLVCLVCEEEATQPIIRESFDSDIREKRERQSTNLCILSLNEKCFENSVYVGIFGYVDGTREH